MEKFLKTIEEKIRKSGYRGEVSGEEIYLELWGNPEVTKFIVAEGKMLKEQVHQRLRKEIETYKNANIQYWPIYLIETNQNVGCCGLRTYDSESNTLEIGIHLKEAY